MVEEDRSPFHEGEAAIQKRLGIETTMAKAGRRFILPFMRQQHRDFFEALRLVILGAVDSAGAVWAVPVIGAPGFITTPDESTLSLGARPMLQEVLALDLSEGQKVGLLGLDFATRRRNRLNGSLKKVGEQSLILQSEQSFGNCPQHIQVRKLVDQGLRQSMAPPLVTTDPWTPEIRRCIERADFFFMASRTKDFNADPRTGIDASHRGGPPGFVQWSEDGLLTFPDYAGNRLFNSLGNILSDGRVGLLFMDFTQGDLVVITGRAEIFADPGRLAAFPGAQHVVVVRFLWGVFAPGVLPFREGGV